jgi:hypothetical protein
VAFARKIETNQSKSCKLKTLSSAYVKAGHPEDSQDLEGKIALLEEKENEEPKERISDEEIARLMTELKGELNTDDTTEEQKNDIINNIIELNQEIRAKHPALENPDCWIDCEDIINNIIELNQEILSKHPALENSDCWINCEFQFLDKYCRIQKAIGLPSARLAKLFCLQPTKRLQKKRVKIVKNQKG